MPSRRHVNRSDILGLCVRVNDILNSSNGIKEEGVDAIVKEFKGYQRTRLHDSLLPSLTTVLRVRSLLPDIFLNPPLAGFSEDRSELIGEGSFGSVYKTWYQGEEVAVKVLRQEAGGTIPDYVRPFLQEVQLWKGVSASPYITHFYGCSVSLNRNPRLVFTLVSPLADHSLRKHAIDKRPYRDTCKLITDVAKGLRDLHEMGFIHGDLHLDNVLVFKRSAKLVDFGLVKMSHTRSAFSLAGKCLNLHPGRVSPEVLKGNSGFGRSSQSDIFSYGRLVYELFNPNHEMFVYPQYIEYPPRPQRMMNSSWDGLWELLLKCCEKNPGDRPTAADVVSQLDNIFN